MVKLLSDSNHHAVNSLTVLLTSLFIIITVPEDFRKKTIAIDSGAESDSSYW